MNAVREYEQAEQRLLERYGMRARPRYIDLAEPRLRARILEVGDGPPVLFVHGGGGAAMNWILLLAQLPGIRAIAVDRPGHGLSGPFDYRGIDLRRHAVSFVTSVLDSLGLERAPIVRTRWGAVGALGRPRRARAGRLARAAWMSGVHPRHGRAGTHAPLVGPLSQPLVAKHPACE